MSDDHKSRAARLADLKSAKARAMSKAASGAPGCVEARKEVTRLTSAILACEMGRG